MHQRSRFTSDGNGRFASYGSHGGGFNRGPSKQFYAPPAQALPPPQHQKEILLAAGRLAAEYLVAKGKLPASALSRSYSGSVALASEMKSPAQEMPPPTFLDDRRNYGSPRGMNSGSDRRRFDDDYEYSRSRRNGLSGSRGKRKFGYYNGRDYSDWGRSRDRNGPMERSRGYSNSMEDDDDDVRGAPGFRRERGNDDFASSASDLPPKDELMGDNELEDSCSKSSSSNARKDGLADMESVVSVKNEADYAKKMPRLSGEDANEDLSKSADECANDPKQGDGEVMKCEGAVDANEENELVDLSNATVLVPVDEAIASENKAKEHTPTAIVQENLNFNQDEPGTEDVEMETNDLVKSSGDKLPDSESDTPIDCASLMKFCDFGPVPKRSRTLVHGSTRRNHRVGETYKGVDLAMRKYSDDIQQIECEDSLKNKNNTDEMVAGTYLGESVAPPEIEIVSSMTGAREENNEQPQLKAAEGDREYVLSSTATVETQQHHSETVVIALADDEKPAEGSAFHISAEEAAATAMDSVHSDQQAMKILDLNRAGTPEINEIPDDHEEGQAQGELSEDLLKNEVVHFSPSVLAPNGTEVVTENPGDANAVHSSRQELAEFAPPRMTSGDSYNYSQASMDDKVVQVINLADSPVVEPAIPKEDPQYQSLENMMNQQEPADAISSIPDGYNLDFLGSDMPCYPSMQEQLQAGMGLNVPEGIPHMDDPIYESLGDIGFIGVWDHQPAQEYEKFF